MNVLRIERSVSLHRPSGPRGLLQMTKNNSSVSAHRCFLSRRALYLHGVAHVTFQAMDVLSMIGDGASAVSISAAIGGREVV